MKTQIRILARSLRAAQAAWHILLGVITATAAALASTSTEGFVDPGAAAGSIVVLAYVVVRHKHGGRAAAYVFCGGWVAICSGLLLFAATAGDTYIAELNAQQNDSVRLRALLLLAGGLLGLQPVSLIVRLVTACTAVFLIGLTFAAVHLRTGDAHIRETAYWRIGHIVVGFLVSLAASRSPLFAPLVSISELLEGSAAHSFLTISKSRPKSVSLL